MKIAEAKKIILEKNKKKYEKAIQKIESQLLAQTGSQLSFRRDHLPVFVVEAIIKHFKDGGWKVSLDSYSHDIIIRF